MKEEKDFRQWYQKKVRENAQDPPKEVWENISDRLDVKDVWGKVSAELDEKARLSSGKAKIYYATAALLVLVIIAGVIGTVKYELFGFSESLTVINSRYDELKNAVGEEQVEKNIDQKKLRTENRNPLNLLEEDYNVMKVWKEENGHEENRHNDLSETNQNTPEQAGPKQKLENKNPTKGDYNKPASEGVEDMPADIDQKSFQKVASVTDTYQILKFLKPVYPLFSFNLQDMNMVIPDSATLAEKMLIASANQVDQEESEKDRQKRSIQIGLVTSAKNTWLLNKLTYTGFEKHTLHTTVPEFGKDIGFLVDYGLSEKLGIKGEAIFLSEMGQKYKEYRNGKYVTRKVNLEYYSFNILLKYKAKRFLGDRGSDILVGSYGSVLKNAYESINGEEFDKKSQILPYDFGVIVGYELNREILKNLILTSGLRFNYGLLNVYTNEVNHTSNGSVSLNFAIKYKIPRKNREVGTF